MKKIILASSSPRRRELLEMLGLKFKVIKSNVDEKLNPRLKPLSQAEDLSRQKAEAIARKYDDAIVIGADTFVVVDNEIIGKPKDAIDALRILSKLNGKIHTVITGFTIIDTATNKSITKSVTTKLFMRRLSKQEIASYIKKEHVYDKAGSYAINGIGAIFFEKIEGDYFSVVGLPLFLLAQELKRFGVGVL
jgi:septum formation protein